MAEQSGEGKRRDVLSEAEEVTTIAQLDHLRRGAAKAVLGIPQGEDVSDEELERCWQKKLEENDISFEGKWGETEEDFLHRIQRRYKL